MDSRVVAHPSTNTAWRSLTSLFGWEAVLSAQCGRIRLLTQLFLHHIPIRASTVTRRALCTAAERGALSKGLGEVTMIFRYPHRVLRV